MPFISWRIHINESTDTELLLAELINLSFSGFEESDSEILAYIDSKDHSYVLIADFRQEHPDLTIEVTELNDENWNEVWESNFEPVFIDDRVVLRAPFHPPMNKEFEIVMEPKMAFGTGHHETTAGMIRQMLNMDFAGKRVLDMGAGTGVLAIMASKLGAKEVIAIDFDENATKSCVENIDRNKANNISVLLGDDNVIPEQTFDMVLANINRNVLVDLIPKMKTHIEEGYLLLSGILEEDGALIEKEAVNNGFEMVIAETGGKWLIQKYRRV